VYCWHVFTSCIVTAVSICLFFACVTHCSLEKCTLKLDYFVTRISVLRPGTNIILCEARGFVYIRFEVRVNGYQFNPFHFFITCRYKTYFYGKAERKIWRRTICNKSINILIFLYSFYLILSFPPFSLFLSYFLPFYHDFFLPSFLLSLLFNFVSPFPFVSFYIPHLLPFFHRATYVLLIDMSRTTSSRCFSVSVPQLLFPFSYAQHTGVTFLAYNERLKPSVRTEIILLTFNLT
jgi:hypothetical protein